MDIHYKRTNSILDKICEQKIIEIKLLDKRILGFEVEKVATVSFLDSLIGGDKMKVIAEIKKASPSEGVIREEFDPKEIAQTYERIGASALSVLTDEKFFQGNIENLKIAKHVTKLPVLRKDFIIHESQIFESKAIGADAILLIASILENSQMKEYMQIAREIGLDVIFETHDEDEVQTAIDLKAGIIGINNRDLKTFKTDLLNFEKLSKMIPEGKIIVAESGINSKTDVEYLKNNKANAVLIGTTLMKADNIEDKFKEIFR